MIAAMAANRIIGDRGAIPWKIPGEQKLFRRITLGHTVILGRKTYESIGRPLPGRTNIVVTRQTDYQAPGCQIANDLAGALKACHLVESEAFICGGGQLYHEGLPLADRIYLTVLAREIAGDTYFPEIPASSFELIQSERIHGVEPYDFNIYERIKD
jgi:dihydrofolate reductase